MPLLKLVKTKKGFTLIELLVVLTIISLMVAVGITSWTNAKVKSRDNKRKADLKTIQQALEAYFQATGNYPNAGITWLEAYASSGGSPTWLPQLAPGYISAVPHDPNNVTYVYLYCVVPNHMRYALAAILENTSDPDRNTSSVPECPNSGAWAAFNYWVTNP